MKLNLVSVNMRLLRLVSPFIAIVLLQAFLAGMSLTILSSVRAYVGGESLWSKGQKDAIHYLYLYGETGEERLYEQFRDAAAVPFGDRDARRALELKSPTSRLPARAFCKAGTHPDDVDGLIWLYHYFRHLPPFRKAHRPLDQHRSMLVNSPISHRRSASEMSTARFRESRSKSCAARSANSIRASRPRRWRSPKASAAARGRSSSCS